MKAHIMCHTNEGKDLFDVEKAPLVARLVVHTV